MSSFRMCLLACLTLAGTFCPSPDLVAQERPRQRAGQQRRTAEQQWLERLDSLERRVQFLEIARRAYDEAGYERNERALANAVRYGALLLEGGSEEALGQAAEGVPSIGNLIELLEGAHDILAESGKTERAMACHLLAEFYAARERNRRAEAEQERERPRPANLVDRENRIEIIDLVAKAARLYAEWGDRERTAACRRLVDFYRAREAGAEAGEERKRAGEREADRLRVIRELQERVERLQSDLREIQEILRRLSR